MDSDVILSTRDSVKCYNCGSSCSLVAASSGTWMRSVKRKYDEFEVGNRFYIPGLDLYANAKVEVENECIALRETLTSQQQAIQDLYGELEEERNAASSAANEAMSMILRLQREKAEIQMEARQFKRFAEEKMAHDQQEIFLLEDLLYKREQIIEALTCEIQAYKHRMMSYGFTEEEIEAEGDGFGRNPSIVDIDALSDLPAGDYPRLRCDVNDNPASLGDADFADVENYLDVRSPQAKEYLKSLEHRISVMEKSPSFSQLDGDFSEGGNVLEKVIVGQSPRQPGHRRMFSNDSSNSQAANKERKPPVTDFPMSNGSFKKAEFFAPTENHSQAKNVDNVSEMRDDTCDRVYTVDFVHEGVAHGAGTEASKTRQDVVDDYMNSPRESLKWPDVDPDIKKLYMRLQALEADRESMRQAILSMQTDKAQLMLMKEIAQHFSKEMAPRRRGPVRKASFLGAFSFVSIVKWVVSLVFWKKKARHSRYMYGLSAGNLGLQMLLDKSPQMRQRRCLTSSQLWKHL